MWGEGFAQPSKIKITEETLTATTLWKLEMVQPVVTDLADGKRLKPSTAVREA